MTKLLTKFASVLASLALVLSMVPTSAFADAGLAPADPGTPVVLTDPAPVVPPVVTPIVPTTATTTATTTDSTGTSQNASSTQLSSLSANNSVAPLVVNDGGQFDSFSNGSVNGQGGWKSTGSVDQAIVDNTTGPASFGLKALRMSNASGATGGFDDQVFSTPLADSVGESAATAGAFSVGTRHNHFEMAFDFISTVPNFVQPGLAVTMSPDRGDGSRMSFLRLEDSATGINVFFDDVPGTTNPANFNETQIATNLDRTVPHNIKLTLDTIDGPSNDVVKVYIDGALVKTGTSWENYYRYSSEASAEQSPRIVKTVLFRIKTAEPATVGKGFLFDHVTTSTGDVTPATVPSTTTTVRAANLGTSRTVGSPSWFFYNDSTDTVNNALGSFVAGPGTPPLGTGSAQLNATTSQKVLLGTVGKAGTRLADITALQYSTYKTAGDPAIDPTLQFDFDNDPNITDTTYLGRLVYEPYFTQTIASGTWQTWNTLNDAAGTGTGNWWFSKATTPGALAVAPNLALCPQSNPCTWAEVKAAFPNGAIKAGGILALRVGGWSSDFTGNVDDLVFNTYAGNETVNFENDVPPPTPGGGSGGNNGNNGGNGDNRRNGSGGGGNSNNGNGNNNGGNGGNTGNTGGNNGNNGQVLGAAAFNFTRDLHFGMRGADVKELQTELIAAGYSIPAGATGYFGPQTRAAVAKWQAEHGISPTAGYFGPISRAKYAADGGFHILTTPVTTTH